MNDPFPGKWRDGKGTAPGNPENNRGHQDPYIPKNDFWNKRLN